MGSPIMSAHIMNKTLLMEFLQSARKKKNHKSLHMYIGWTEHKQ